MTEWGGAAAAYRSLPLPGFAHHVIAGHLEGVWRTGPGADISSIGGSSGGSLDLYVSRVGTGGSAHPVRGFPSGVRYGSRIVTGSVEYRVPLILVDRGFRQVPAFLDRISAALFTDFGDAWLPGPGGKYVRWGSGVDPSGRSRPPSPLIGSGGELRANVGLFSEGVLFLRAGVGFPVRGPELGAQGYFSVGSAF